MKQRTNLLIFIILLLFSVKSFANINYFHSQDSGKIIFINGDTVSAKIIDIDKKTITYEKIPQESRLYKTSLRKVYKIIYADGREEIFTRKYLRLFLASLIGLPGMIYVGLQIEYFGLAILLNLLGFIPFFTGIQAIYRSLKFKQKGIFGAFLVTSIGLVNLILLLSEILTIIVVLIRF